MSFKDETIKFSYPDSDLVSLAKRYVPTGAAFATNGLTFVLGHNVSSHKEMWEPVITELFDLCSSSSDPRFRIREVWSLEWQSHGQTAVVNEDNLDRRDGVSPSEYGTVLRYFVLSEHVAGHRIVPVGFSASTSAWALAMLSMASLPFTAVIFIEPTILIPPILPDDPRAAQGVANRKAVLSRKDKWASMEEASEWMRKRYPWKLWDKRVFNLYLKYALREKSSDGQSFVTLSCSIAQEVNAYDAESHFAAAPGLSKACSNVKVHAFFGERPELVTLAARNSMCDATEGRSMATVNIIPNAGHLVVCEKPTDVARRIFGTMATIDSPRGKANL